MTDTTQAQAAYTAILDELVNRTDAATDFVSATNVATNTVLLAQLDVLDRNKTAIRNSIILNKLDVIYNAILDHAIATYLTPTLDLNGIKDVLEKQLTSFAKIRADITNTSSMNVKY